MATKTVTFRCQEEESRQMSQSMKLDAQVKRTKFQSSGERQRSVPLGQTWGSPVSADNAASREKGKEKLLENIIVALVELRADGCLRFVGTAHDEEASYSEYYPIIPGDLISAKELLNFGSDSRHRTWRVLRRTIADDEQRKQVKWTLFGNEAEKLEMGLIRTQRILRTRADHERIRREAEERASIHKKFVEDLSMKPPDFPVPLRCHTVWEGMGVKLACTVQGHPPPQVNWYKDGVLLKMFQHPWNYKLHQSPGLNVLEIRRCSVEDGGEYKAVAKSSLGEATTYATLLVNCPVPEPEARFASAFPPSFTREGESITLRCDFSSALLPSQQDVAWFCDGLPVRSSSRAELQTGSASSSLTLKGVHKEQEGVYTVRLSTSEGVKEHKAYVYVTGEAGLGMSRALVLYSHPPGLQTSSRSNTVTSVTVRTLALLPR
ncbi:hypothetical protein COCON_G00018780 [Conger conger]|uniref:Ig-like domain-containing protein n=1 Tax=Conger conger TaxID=82655 RepID=A0A9Q1E426_CONCO|nr:hypothetical protein COCON_G00018780 [Conger conger]